MKSRQIPATNIEPDIARSFDVCTLLNIVSIVFDSVCNEYDYDFMVCEEGKIYGFPFNRYIYDKQDLVAGNLVIIKADTSSGEFVSLTEEETNFLLDKIKNECPMYEDNQIEIEESEEIEK